MLTWNSSALEKYRVSQKFVPLLCKSVVTYDCTNETNHLCKSCLFLIKYHIFFAPSFYWEIQFLHFSAKGMHVHLCFPAKYLLYFVS